MTLAELAVTIALLGALGLAASRFGLSAIPAYLLAGIILGPNEPDFIQLIQPSEVTDFVAEIGLIFLLFFLGLEFSVERLVRSGRHVGLGGAADLVVNAASGCSSASRPSGSASRRSWSRRASTSRRARSRSRR